MVLSIQRYLDPQNERQYQEAPDQIEQSLHLNQQLFGSINNLNITVKRRTLTPRKRTQLERKSPKIHNHRRLYQSCIHI